MILVIPVSTADIDMAENQAYRIKLLGDVDTKLIIPCSWKVHWDIDRITRILPYAEVFILPFEEETGWPESANLMFYQTAQYVAQHYPNDDWYFMEADVYPLKHSWWDRLQTEYNQVGKPYMGVISNSIRMIDGALKITGKHMTGTAIYPKDFLSRCKSIHYLMRDPWDIEIGPEILPDVHDTKLIAHRWGSYGYHWKDGQICITGSRSYSPTHTRPIQPEAVVVHGCKDGSINALDLSLVVG